MIGQISQQKLRSRLLSVLLLAPLLTSSCATGRSNTSKRGPDDTEACKTTAVDPQSLSGYQSTDKLKVEPVADFSVVGEIFSLEISDHYAAWVGTDAKKVYAWACVYDLRTGKARKAAEIQPDWYATGGIGLVRVSGDTLVYWENEEPPLSYYDVVRPISWAVWSVDLNTGEKRKLFASSNTFKEWIEPDFAIEWPWVLLGGTFSSAKIQKANKWHLDTYDLRSNKKRVLVPDLETGHLSIDRGMAIYPVFSAGDSGDDSTWRNDLFMIPVDGSAPATQIHDRDAGWPEAESGTVTWQEGTPSTPTSRTTPWLKFIGSDKPPIRLAEEGNNVRPGDGFAMWLGFSHLLVRDPLSPDPPIPLAQYVNIPARWRTHGQLAIWATYDKDWPAHDKNDDPYVIHVVRVTKN